MHANEYLNIIVLISYILHTKKRTSNSWVQMKSLTNSKKKFFLILTWYLFKPNKFTIISQKFYWNILRAEFGIYMGLWVYGTFRIGPSTPTQICWSETPYSGGAIDSKTHLSPKFSSQQFFLTHILQETVKTIKKPSHSFHKNYIYWIGYICFFGL